MQLLPRKTLFETRSPYGSYRVMEGTYLGRPARVLYGEKRSPQSGMALDDKPELLFDYNQRFMELIMSVRPKKLLVIGGGVGMLPTAALYRFPTMQIDVVEIDSVVVSIAREYFDFPDDPRLRVIVDDGLRYIEHTKAQYDMIILDAFLGYTIPHHLLEARAVKAYASHLTPAGVVAINFISEYTAKRPRLAHELLATFDEVFSQVTLFQSDAEYPKGDEQNRLLVASQQALNLEYVQSEPLKRL